MVSNIASFFRELQPPDFYLLSGIEHGMRFSEWVKRSRLPDLTNLSAEEIDYRIDRCMDFELIERQTIQYEGYKLRFEGYDALALRTFTERDTIEAFGAPLGVGKESDVFEVQSYKPVALKFHREGYTNFREVMREREYTADREHVSWLYTARKAAEHEYDVLSTLYPAVSVPRPIDHNRHAIVMSKFDGTELSSVEIKPSQAAGLLDLILRELQTAYDNGFVHADMSEYNVAVSTEGITIFDWPQAVPTDHNNALEHLERDITNLTGYLRRKHPDKIPDLDARAIASEIQSGSFHSITQTA